MTHTKTPWTTDNATSEPMILTLDGETNIAMCFDVHEETAANAAHIVKCVNLHYDLIAELEYFVRQQEDVFKGGNVNASLTRAKELLAKAKGTT